MGRQPRRRAVGATRLPATLGLVLGLGLGLVAAVLAPAGGAVAPVGTRPHQTAAAADVTVAVVPAAVPLVPGDEATVTVVITNPSPDPATVTAFEVLAPARIEVTAVPAPADVGPVPAFGFARTTFALRGGPGLEAGTVDVVVEVEVSAADGPRRRLVTAAVAVTAGTATQSPELAFVSAPASLNDGQRRRATLQLSNPTPFPFAPVWLYTLDSEDVSLRPAPSARGTGQSCEGAAPEGPGPALGCIARLEPGSVQVLAVELRADDEVRTGTQRLAVVATARRDGASGTITADLVATTDVALTIFGVDALSPFGVSAIFVLPGVLAVVTALALGRFVYPRHADVPDEVDMKDPRVLPWVVVPGVIAYLAIWLVRGRDLTDEAGRWDVVALFVLGAALGGLAWGALALVWYLRTGRKQFSPADGPGRVLRRLEARQARLTLPEVTVDGMAYRYLSVAPGQNQAFVCPPVAYTFTPTTTQAQREGFRAELDKPGSVRRAEEEGLVRLRWTVPTGVRTVAATATGALAHLLGEAQEAAG